MKFGSMKEALLSSAKETFLFDCRVIGLDSQTIQAYSAALTAFIRFTGNILVKELTPEHVRVYIDNLSDGPDPAEREEPHRAVIGHYALIHEWMRWLYAQKFATRRSSENAEPPRLMTRRFSFARRIDHRAHTPARDAGAGGDHGESLKSLCELCVLCGKRIPDRSCNWG